MKPSTDTTSTPDSQSSIVILFGVDEHDKPRAATFTGPDTGLLTKAAAAMSLRLAEAKTTELQSVRNTSHTASRCVPVASLAG